MTATDADLTASEVVWDLTPLLPDPGEKGVAELLDAADARADERLAFARHHLRSERRYRPHLLTEPEEVVLTEKAMTGRSAFERLFEEQVSSIAVELDGTSTTLEAALGQLHAPEREIRRRAADAITA